MKRAHILQGVAFGALLLMVPVSAQQPQRPAPSAYPGPPSETPATFEPVTDSFDYVKRDVMIPMRDGVKLHTVALAPKGKTRADPDSKWPRARTTRSGGQGDQAEGRGQRQGLSGHGPLASRSGDRGRQHARSAKPAPFRSRPIQPVGYDRGLTWPQWLVDDQREASGRPDVAAFVSEVLRAPVKISGEPVANVIASTSGSDAGWVVKLIDVYPDEVAGQPAIGGYQLMVSADIFRGRYRESFETPKAIASDRPLPYRFALPTANHVFLPGHRIMVQVQSSWFPLYDRNPQTFV